MRFPVNAAWRLQMESKLPSSWHGNFGTFSAELCKQRCSRASFAGVTDAIGNLLFPGYWSMKTVRRSQILAARDEKRERNETSDFDISEDKKVLEMRGWWRRCRSRQTKEKKTIENGNKTASYLQLWHRQDCFSPQWPPNHQISDAPEFSRSCITNPVIYLLRGE